MAGPASSSDYAPRLSAALIGTSNTRTATLYRVQVSRPPFAAYTLLKSVADFSALHKALSKERAAAAAKVPPLPSLAMGYSFRSNAIARMEVLNAEMCMSSRSPSCAVSSSSRSSSLTHIATCPSRDRGSNSALPRS